MAYTPEIGGDYYISVKHNGIDIQSSPFTISSDPMPREGYLEMYRSMEPDFGRNLQVFPVTWGTTSPFLSPTSSFLSHQLFSVTCFLSPDAARGLPRNVPEHGTRLRTQPLGTGLLPLLKRQFIPWLTNLPGQWLQSQANGSNVNRVLRGARSCLVSGCPWPRHALTTRPHVKSNSSISRPRIYLWHTA